MPTAQSEIHKNKDTEKICGGGESCGWLDSREGDGEGESLPQVDAHEGDVGDIVDCGGAPGSGSDGSRQRGDNNQFLAVAGCQVYCCMAHPYKNTSLYICLALK